MSKRKLGITTLFLFLSSTFLSGGFSTLLANGPDTLTLLYSNDMKGELKPCG